MGYINKIPPTIYVDCAPNTQKLADATIGPIARASAPNDLNIPRMDPFWLKLPYFDMSVVIHVTTKAVAK